MHQRSKVQTMQFFPIPPGASPLYLWTPILSGFRNCCNGCFFVTPDIDPHASLLLQHMRHPDSLLADASPPAFITTEGHISGWKRANENASAGYSGIHFGMYKAQARDPDLAEYDAALRNIPYSFGCSLPRWQTGVDVMLLKASGDLCAEKLRTILLLEADFNVNNKKLSRDGMYIAEKYGCIAPEQAGGRRLHRATETSLNSVLTCDDSRFHRKAMVICPNDAKGCYDRIVHSVAYMCL
jgi:hypothetical protein